MYRYRVAIVEDEKVDSDGLQDCLTHYVSEHGRDLTWQVFRDGDSFLQSCGSGYDIVLMDIEMPGLNGIEVAKQLRKEDDTAVLIFVTHMVNYAIEGYAVRAMDFLVKPVEYQNFRIKMDRAIELLEKTRGSEFTIQTSTGLRRIRTDEIQYIEVMDHTLLFHLNSGELTLRGSIKDYEEKLSPFDFVRCNNSFLINLRHVKELDGNDVLIDKHRIPVGRTKKKEILQKLTEYFGDTVL